MVEFETDKYITLADFLDRIGIKEADQDQLTTELRNRYQRFVDESNAAIEAELINLSATIPLKADSKELTYSQHAAMHWAIYLKRDFVGSRNAKNAKADYEKDINLLKELLKFEPTDRTIPIQIAETTDSLVDVIIPYSQTQGYPPELLY